MSHFENTNKFAFYSSQQCYNKSMFLVGMLSWWYKAGWMGRFRAISEWLKKSYDLFSFATIIPNFFAPFRQISSYSDLPNSISNQMKMFFDKLLSRFIGAFMRLCILIFGIAYIILQFFVGLLIALFWIFVPLLPIFGIVMMTLRVDLL